MAKLAAIDIADDIVTVLFANSNEKQLTISKIIPIERELLTKRVSESDANPEGEEREGNNGADHSELLDERLQTIQDELLEAESVYATINGEQVLYENFLLPFRDPKKVARIAPLQLQDSLPFEPDNFLLDHTLLNRTEAGSFNFLSSLIPETEVSDALNDLQTVRVEPKVLTSRPGAVALLPTLFPDILTGSFAILVEHRASYSLAVFVNDHLVTLRELLVPSNGNKTFPFSELFCTLTNAESRSEVALHTLYFLGSEDLLAPLKDALPIRVEALDIRSVVDSANGVNPRDADIYWSLGLFSHSMYSKELKDKPLIDFRVGKYAYKPAWGDFIGSFKDELFYFTLLGFFALTWVATSIFVSHQRLSTVDDYIENEVRGALPGQAIPYQREVSTLEQEVSIVEDQLRSMGSLSSLSPLDALREITRAIPENVDMAIDSMNLGAETLVIQGSVKDFPAVGRLNSALENPNAAFCETKVDSKGKLGSSSRVRFTAEIKLCD